MQWENFSKMKILSLVTLVSTSGTTHYNQQCRFSAAPGRLSCPTVPRLTGGEDNRACFWFLSFLHALKIGVLFDCHLNKNWIFNLKKRSSTVQLQQFALPWNSLFKRKLKGITEDWWKLGFVIQSQADGVTGSTFETLGHQEKIVPSYRMQQTKNPVPFVP